MSAKETAQAKRMRVLKNGAIYDLDKGRIVANPGGGSKAITKENSSEYHARRQALKRERVQAGANAVVAGMGSVRDGKVFKGEDLDFIEAISEQVTIKALDPTDPKQVDAFRALLQESGLSEKQVAEQQQPGISALLLIAARMIEQQPDIIDAVVEGGDAILLPEKGGDATPTPDG